MPADSTLASYLLIEDPDDERFIDPELLDSLATRCTEDDSVPVAVVEAAEYLSQQMIEMTMDSGCKPYIMVRAKQI